MTLAIVITTRMIAIANVIIADHHTVVAHATIASSAIDSMVVAATAFVRIVIVAPPLPASVLRLAATAQAGKPWTSGCGVVVVGVVVLHRRC